MTPCSVVLQHVYRMHHTGQCADPKFVHMVMRVEPKAGFFYYSDSCVGEARAVCLFNSSR
jgi:hypothetical protein